MVQSVIHSTTDRFGLFTSERTALLSKTDLSFYLTLNLFEGYEIFRSDPVHHLPISAAGYRPEHDKMLGKRFVAQMFRLRQLRKLEETAAQYSNLHVIAPLPCHPPLMFTFSKWMISPHVIHGAVFRVRRLETFKVQQYSKPASICPKNALILKSTLCFLSIV